ncbi:MAG TPA: ROK family transcriptional regulator [Pseudonocardiaceae bacterium]|nr:ROK family transcriptional regulator [Pseudonocardiaceae bacterium]
MREAERGAGAAGMRRHNLALVLRLITESGPVSRVELAGRTGLTKATVSSLVSELLEAMLVHDIGPAGGTTAGGRPATLLEPAPLGPLAVGLQFDLDHVAGCLVDLGGRVRARELRRVHAAGLGPRELVGALRPLLGRLLTAAVDAGRLVAGVGVAAPAVMAATEDADDPLLAWAPQFGWRDADLHAALSGALTALGAPGMAVRIGNDAACAARAEFRAGHPDAGLALYLGGESEIGACVVADGVPRPGVRLGGSAFGHVPLRPRGARCPCGARGCLDSYAGRAALLTAAGRPDQGLTRMTGGARLSTALTSTEAGQRAVAAAADALGEALGPLLAVLDPDLVVLGGRLGGLGDAVLEPLRRRLSGFVPGLAEPIPLRAATLGPDAAMRGAALAIVGQIVAEPLAWITEMFG